MNKILAYLLLITATYSNGQINNNVYTYKNLNFEVLLSLPQNLNYNEKDINDDDAFAHIINFEDKSAIIISTGMIQFAIDLSNNNYDSSCPCSKTIKRNINNTLWRRDKYKSVNLYYIISDLDKEFLFDKILDEAVINYRY